MLTTDYQTALRERYTWEVFYKIIPASSHVKTWTVNKSPKVFHVWLPIAVIQTNKATLIFAAFQRKPSYLAKPW